MSKLVSFGFLVGMGLIACGEEKEEPAAPSSEDDVAPVDDTAAGDDTGGGEVSAATTGQLVVHPADNGLSADLAVELRGGVAYANAREDGALFVALSSWEDLGCDSGAWIRDAMHQDGAYGWVEAGIESFEGLPTAAVTWGDGSTSGSGRLSSAGTVVLEPGVADGLVAGDLVAGELAFTDADNGVEVSATFTVTYCGDSFQ